MSPRAWPWDVLGLTKAPKELSDLRRAYAQALKKIDQSTDIAGFTALRDAYEEGMRRILAKANRRKGKSAPIQATAVQPLPSSNPQPVSTTAPDRRSATASHAPDPAPDPAENMLRDLTKPNAVSHLNDRILAALNNPVSLDPHVDADLRRTIARMLQGQLLTSHDGTASLPSHLRPAILALDARYHWLSDFAAYRRDFWDHAAMLDALHFAAGIESRATIEIFHRPRWALTKRLSLLLGSAESWLVAVALLGASGIAILTAPRESIFGSVTYTAVIVVLSAMILLPVLWAAITAVEISWFVARRAYELWQDRRAMKAKGIVPPKAPPTKTSTAKYWILFFIFQVCIQVAIRIFSD